MMISQRKRSFVTAIERAHGSQLRRFLSVRLRDEPAAVQDLVQEIYLRLLRVEDHDAIRNPQAYLYTIASHVLHQHLLRRTVIPETMDPLAVVCMLDRQHDTALDPADEAEIEQRIEAVGRALQARSPRAYAALLMYRCEGLTFKQIGQRLGVSNVMARKYLASAISYFDSYFAEGGTEAP